MKREGWTQGMNSGYPLISVLLPAYNAEQYLSPAIDSILRQTFQDFELIAVDDGSTDATLEILRRYERADPRVSVISRANTGIVGALNDALHASRGQLLARMDGDDICLPTRFERQVNFLHDHPSVVMVATNVMVIDSEGDDVAPLKGLEFTHDGINRQLLARHWPVVHPTVMIRKEAMVQVDGYREGTFPHEDHDLFLRLGEIGELAAIPEVLLKYRRHPRSVSWDSRSYGKMDSIVRQACARRGVPYIEENGEQNDRRRAAATEPETVMRGRLYRTWAWHALSAGNVSTARKYAFRAVKCRPWERENLKLLACIARGH